mgnify:CR=1 FL=1
MAKTNIKPDKYIDSRQFWIDESCYCFHCAKTALKDRLFKVSAVYALAGIKSLWIAWVVRESPHD